MGDLPAGDCHDPQHWLQPLSQ